MGKAAPHRVVVIGGGFGGLHAAQKLRRAPVQVTLIDRRNFHLFQPLLYQVATGSLSPANIAAPLRSILRKQQNAETLLAEVTGFDVARKRVLLADGEVPYDSLIVAAGSRYNYFGHSDWEERAPSLKTLEDATEIRRRVLVAFERAERELDAARRRAWLTFVIVGAGPTGVEMAGALAEIARQTLKNDFRHIDPAEAQVVLVEGGERVLATYPPVLSDKANGYLKRLNIQVRTKAFVTDIHETAVQIKSGADVELLPARTVIWAAGVSATPLARSLSEATGAQVDRIGRLVVGPDLSIAGHPEIFVIGDMANVSHQNGEPLPGVAPAAIQEGKYVARLIRARLEGKSLPPFAYRDMGSMATIGRSAAVALIGGRKLSGFVAWVLWLFVHLMQIVEFENRLLVLFQWAWNYFTFGRTARLITGAPLAADERAPGSSDRERVLAEGEPPAAMERAVPAQSRD
jgi:NADH:ubiquinone reductase (H+-translocating)